MSYHPSHASAHHNNLFGAGLSAINYAHNHTANASSATNPSLLSNSVSSHSFPMAPSPSNGTPQSQQQEQAAVVAVQQQQQQQQHHAQASTSNGNVPPGVPDSDGLIAPPSMPLELDFDNLESASNYMHTYALSQGFDIRIQWSANHQTRICWSCYRGGFPESLNSDGTPNTRKRQIPKEKERRKRGSLKIGCPFRVQCTKNWGTGKMELRILEGRHKHQMETDREHLPSQVRRIKNQRKAHDSPDTATRQGGNAAANAVAVAANLSATPTPAPSGSMSGSNAAKARASGANNSSGAIGIGTAPRRPQQLLLHAQTPVQGLTSNNVVVNASNGSAHSQLNLLGSNPALGTPTRSNGANTALDFETPELALAPSGIGSTNGAIGSASGAPKPSFERRMLYLLGVYDRSDGSSKETMDRELDTMLSRAESRLDKNARKKRKIGPSDVGSAGTNAQVAATCAARVGHGVTALARGMNGTPTATITTIGAASRSGAVEASPLRATTTVGVGSMPQTRVDQMTAKGGQSGVRPSSGKGSAQCSNCKEYGHNRRRCPLG
ncbi:uncharacterized protein MEPE_04057 [Melanopsichium pennsylvanicum]|uniref:CCHC-type domain-containing protein n=2 Tax=Melanopsichium pennsylvanicum TaxID=63383 RepID=A0AAJ5C6A1_9BASI|nr:hypothetical protein BN887_04468 [Melanopsichium pennsylvanicum 4]SNX85348.1 uncharacterized protein MEPE_04057 [Melanopsichium pennsylvanicum]